MSFDLIRNAIADGKHLFIGGGAGVGKTTITKQLVNHLKEKESNFALTTTTGIASLQYDNAETIHRCTGIGIKTNPNDLNRVTSGRWREKNFPRLRQLEYLILDEVSLMRPDTLELINLVLQKAKGNYLKPFGGVQAIFVGDWLQLPPVIKQEEELVHRWAFQSDIWKSLNPEPIILMKVHRQNDEQFITALRRVRAGMLDGPTNYYLQQTENHVFDKEVTPLKIMSTNDKVDDYNVNELSKLTDANETYTAKIAFEDEFVKKKIMDDCPAPFVLNLKKGCQVIILKNDPEGEYVNGSMGFYQGQNGDKELVIELMSNGEKVFIDKHKWVIEDHLKDNQTMELASLVQYPVKLGYAITVHRSQGMSLDCAEIDMQRFFACGQAYVALSRVRTYQGLKIKNYHPKHVKVDELALNFYKDLALRN